MTEQGSQISTETNATKFAQQRRRKDNITSFVLATAIGLGVTTPVAAVIIYEIKSSNEMDQLQRISEGADALTFHILHGGGFAADQSIAEQQQQALQQEQGAIAYETQHALTTTPSETSNAGWSISYPTVSPNTVFEPVQEGSTISNVTNSNPFDMIELTFEDTKQGGKGNAATGISGDYYVKHDGNKALRLTLKNEDDKIRDYLLQTSPTQDIPNPDVVAFVSEKGDNLLYQITHSPTERNQLKFTPVKPKTK